MTEVLDELVSEYISVVDASNQPLFRDDFDYDEALKKRDAIVKEWSSLGADDRAVFSSQKAFEAQRGLIDLKDPSLIPAKNYSLLVHEVMQRRLAVGDIVPLPIDGLDFDESVLEMAESVENVAQIRQLYRLRKKTVGAKKNSGISADEALSLKNCFTQGRELYVAGRNGSLMVKPLNFFYAITAYSYGIIILNNPIRYHKKGLPGSHGMGYLPDGIQAQFGGDSPQGTFSDLVTSFPTQLIQRGPVEFHIDCVESIMALYHKRYTVGLGTLISMVPEMSDYYKLTTGRNSRCHPLEIVTANDHQRLKWEFNIGNGEHSPPLASIEEAFAGFENSTRFGKFVITIPAAEAHKIKTCIFSDIRGKLWFIENPFYPVILPEIGIHFLINSLFSNVMRYRPDEWGSVLRNEVASNISLLTRHYFSAFQRKFFIVVLRAISQYSPYVV
jgi:hypothetical protein